MDKLADHVAGHKVRIYVSGVKGTMIGIIQRINDQFIWLGGLRETLVNISSIQRIEILDSQEHLSVQISDTTEAGASISGNSADAEIEDPDWAAFVRERASLLHQYPGGYVAYHKGVRVAVGNNEDEVIEAAKEVAPPGILLVQQIIPEEQDRVVRFSSPRQHSSLRV